MKKILVISHDFVKKVNIRIYEELSQKKNIKLLCVKPKNLVLDNKSISTDFKIKNSKVKIIETKIVFNNLRFIYFKNLYKIIKKFKPSKVIVHNDPASIQVLLLIFYSFFKRFSIYCMSNENRIVNLNEKYTIIKIFRSILLIFTNFFLKFKIKNILCISNQIKKNYDFLGYKKKTVLLPLGFDQNIFNKKQRKKNKTFIISYFGRISSEKGIHVLIKSLKQIDFKFKFYLDVSHINNMQYFKMIIKDLEKIIRPPNIKYIKCDHNKIANFMRKSDLVVVPSLYEEQYGRVIQESVACGCLVIGSRVGAIPEIIKDKDLLFIKNDHKELSQKINRLKNSFFFKNKLKSQHKQIFKERTLIKQLEILNKLFK